MQFISTTSCDLNETSLALDIVWSIERMDAIFTNWALLNPMSIINLHRKVDIWKYNILCRSKKHCYTMARDKNFISTTMMWISSRPWWSSKFVLTYVKPFFPFKTYHFTLKWRKIPKLLRVFSILQGSFNQFVTHHCLNHVPCYFSWGNP
jgi:hypothetical protein